MAKRLQEEAIIKAMEAKTAKYNDIQANISDANKLYGFNVGDVIIIKETGEATTIEAFTNDKKMICKLDDEYRIFDFGEFRLV